MEDHGVDVVGGPRGTKVGSPATPRTRSSCSCAHACILLPSPSPEGRRAHGSIAREEDPATTACSRTGSLACTSSGEGGARGWRGLCGPKIVADSPPPPPPHDLNSHTKGL
ncbi:unnamed protein product [Urochloa humidicola]